MAITLLQEKELLEMAMAGVAPTDIANEVGVSIPTVYAVMRKHGILEQLKAKRDQKVIEAYQDGQRIVAITEAFQVSQFQLYRILERHGIKMRRGSPNTRRDDEDQICELYKGKTTLSQIRRITGRSIGYIYDVLDRNNIPRRAETDVWEAAEE